VEALSPTVSRTRESESAILRALSNEAVQVAGLLLIALLVRVAFHVRSPALVTKDSQSYFLPGWEIARGQPFELGQRRTPGYPLFIAGVILTLGEDLRTLALAQHLLGVATVGVTYLLGKFTFGRPAGLLAGLLVALSGPLLIYERYVMSETLFGLLLGLSTLAVIFAVRRSNCRRCLVAGLGLGLAVLTRPVAQMLVPLFGLTTLVAGGREWRRGLLCLSALLVGVAAVQGPWVVRNALEKGNPSASTFGRTLINRTAYYDRGFIFDVPGRPDPDPRLQRAREIVQDGARQHQADGVIAGRLRQELDLATPAEVNRVMRDVATQAILRSPGHYLEGTLAFSVQIFVGVEERLREHWDEYKDVNPWDERIRGLVGGPTTAELAERPNASRLVNVYQPAHYAPILAALLLLGIGLAISMPRHRVGLIPACVVLVLLVASAALDGPVERYRYPLDPLISVLVAGGLSSGVGLLLAPAWRAYSGRWRPGNLPAATSG
jgi:4-amino-4-deoxy-L-arabinose transferase-like glycosyltransferase